ncbi:MAG TPA: nucleotidyltransferase family protein, partial [Longimicrobiaceae bacterium]|nr:nucleotidyltransferase family protein [Longimicrobiaceae bacterium]
MEQGSQGEAAREIELLLCCARVRPEPHHIRRMQTLLRQGIDWERMLPLAERHGMLPLLHWHLDAAAADEIPLEMRSRLRVAFLGNAGRVLGLVGELFEILQLFERHGIDAVAYKGPLLSAQLYGDLALRQAGDLDLVLRKANLPCARQLLLQRGYRARAELAPGEEEFALRAGYHEIFDRGGALPFTVELHWAFTRADFAVPLDFDALAPRLESTSLQGRRFSRFAREDLLLILCIHGAKHRWKRLEWICGVAEALRANGEIDWTGLLRHAEALRSRRMLLLGLHLAHKLLDAPLPPELAQEIRSSRWITRLDVQVRHWLRQDGREPTQPHSLLPAGVLFH